ncbi:hypothetical protein J3R82DRAFT_1988 [Butyriboletus roseoflavus]|nr:hypothetical protein J3R82DRAFT_1988 [Butyriboletus roseoflavus]
MLAAYVIGIGVGCCVVFSIVKVVCLQRRRLSLRYGRFEDQPNTEAFEEWQDVVAPKDPPA